MHNKYESLRRKYELAKSDTYQELRKEALDFIISLSTNEEMRNYTQGMLLLIKFFDDFILEYEIALKQRKDEE